MSVLTVILNHGSEFAKKKETFFLEKACKYLEIKLSALEKSLMILCKLLMYRKGNKVKLGCFHKLFCIEKINKIIENFT